jgi:hypothetical protein
MLNAVQLFACCASIKHMLWSQSTKNCMAFLRKPGMIEVMNVFRMHTDDNDEVVN